MEALSIKSLTGGSSSSDAKFVGNVTNGGSFPTTRLDGSALHEGDYVRPKTGSTFPFTIGSVTFTSTRDKAIYSTAGWMIDPGALQDTVETPVKDKSVESLSGNATTQYAINSENKTAIEGKVNKDTTGVDIVYSRINNVDSNQPISKSAVANTVAWRGDNGTLKVGNAVANKDAVNKETMDTALDNKIDKIDGAVSIEHAVVKKSDGTYGLMQVNINSNAGLAIVRRDLDKQINVPLTPLADDDAASKKYVDDNKTIVDSAMSEISTNPVQNKVINQVHNAEVSARQLADTNIMNVVDTKQDKLTAGDNVTIASDSTISSNQVDDSLATSTDKTYSIDKIKEEIRIAGATFRGTFDTKADLDAYSGVKEKNDRAYVTKDETHEDSTTLYSWDGSAWVFEYVISRKPIELDQTTIDYDASGKVCVKDEGISLAKLAKHTGDDGKAYFIQADGTTALENVRQYKKVSTFSGEVGNDYTAYYLDRSCIVGTQTYETGLYVWSVGSSFTLIANVGGGGGTTSPTFVGEVSPGDIFPATRPDASALILGDYVKPFAGSPFPFTIGSVTFTNARDTAVYMGSGNWLLNASVYQKTNETPIVNKSVESVKGTASTANFQKDINAENATAINSKQDKLIDSETIEIDTDNKANLKNADEYIRKPDVKDNLTSTDTDKPLSANQGNVLDALKISKYETLPTASADNLGEIVQYVGATTTDYTNAYFYKCIEDAGTHKWQNVQVQDGGEVNVFTDVTEFPATGETNTLYRKYHATNYKRYSIIAGDWHEIRQDGIYDTISGTLLTWDQVEEQWNLLILSYVEENPSGQMVRYEDSTSASGHRCAYWVDGMFPVSENVKFYHKDQWWQIPVANQIVEQVFDLMYPVTSRYIQYQGMANPNSISGKWEVDTSYDGKALWADSTLTAGSTIAQSLPKPSLTFTGSAVTSGNGSAHTHTFTGSAATSGNQSANHTHSGTTGNQSASHTHNFTTSTRTTSSDGAHTHGMTTRGDYGGSAGYIMRAKDSGSWGEGYTWESGAHTHTVDLSGTLGNQTASHNHTITTGNQSASHTHSVTAKGTNANESAHTHSVTAKGSVSVNTSGAYSDGTKVQPDAVTCVVWKRTA